ncbi:N-6 DNA methylase [Corynebacterium lujinxingii]|uniref:N-6 DNA methylase n=1 Tax=Corynebacterium lujinxingii TaxID=2763010 RepID=A0A7H0JXT2_9CORY|nr:N-6 DNA methylase [Corynebacterium lujinxingii]NNO11731.1 N-6 DNA methylase [Corynebacterium lujinxingii]QNP89848.1 N-6 DNA methylase [Corynebacterium lujinxingii]
MLADLSIGEISVCYEALLASLDPASRRSSGQYFTPDDAAEFMASRAKDFGEGVWMDPAAA